MKTRWWVPWIYAAPALLLLIFFLVYPSIDTLHLSFFDKRGEIFVGFQNYIHSFTNKTMLTAFRNNALWLIGFTLCTVSFGLILAVLLDRVRYERIVKSIIFIPMAISMVGAGTIWKFVYTFRPAGASQIGLLNALVVAFGGQPKGWLIDRPWVNNFCLIVVGIWMWTGFCMVILSAAYKNIPKELLEAARIDGASEWQVFWRVILPLLKPTVAVVTTTMVVFVIKIANRMYKEQFAFRNYGLASAIAVILLLLIIPMMFVNIRRFKQQESTR